jgi:hypothetical protein
MAALAASPAWSTAPGRCRNETLRRCSHRFVERDQLIVPIWKSTVGIADVSGTGNGTENILTGNDGDNC